jgi:prepilin-type N-terminal cleavage/methylation domain-containing protein
MLPGVLESDDIKSCAQHGFTLTELAIVIGIIGLILGAIWFAVGAANANRRTQQAASQILEIIGASMSVSLIRGTIDGADMTCFGVGGGLFPEDMTNPAACVTGNISTYPLNPWNGAVQVASEWSQGSIVVAYYGLDSRACIDLFLAISRSPNVTGQGYKSSAGSWTTQWFPPYGTSTLWSASKISTLCSAPSNTNAIAVAFSQQ